MKTTLEERFRKQIIIIAKKSRFNHICMFPVMAAGTFLFHLVSYMRGNVKRFSMIVMTFLFFVVYSSFSFPMFISGEENELDINNVSEEARDIVLAREAEIDLDEVQLLNDEEEDLSIESVDAPHGMDIEATYSAADILAVTRPAQTGESQSSRPEEDAEFATDDWKLILINREHSIPNDYEFPQGDIKTMKGTMHCDARIIDDLLNMLQAAKDDGITLQICSPYRDQAYQEMLFNRKIKRYLNLGMSYIEAYQLAGRVVQVPGASEHQIGLALDIVTDSYDDLDAGFADTSGGRWLAENCQKYGFILRYPKDREYITGVEYEPWHFRYVGIEAATIIMEQDMTLEEFWEDLERNVSDNKAGGESEEG